MPITLLTHLCCLVAVIVPVTIARQAMPYFGLLRYAIVSMALFERAWLFSRAEVQHKAEPPQMLSAPLAVASTADDEAEWQRYLHQRKPGNIKAGTSLRAEYEQWLDARRKNQPAAQSTPR